MDFFEAQARAKKRSSRLVALFALALVGTVTAGYFATLIWLQNFSQYSHRERVRDYDSALVTDSNNSLWQPQILAAVTVVTCAIVGLASLFKWQQFASGGGAVAESVGGRRVDPRTTDLAERRLLNVVEEMAIAAGLPVPEVYVLQQEPAINAFAAGLTTQDAAITVTKGTLEKLSRDELQGVIGHEFSHVLNGDMRLNLRIAALVFGILVIGLAGRGVLWAMSRGRIRVGRKSGGIVVVLGFIGVALFVIGYAGYFFGRLIQAGISRQREFLADASAVQFTRNPAGVTGALKKIGGYVLGSNVLHNQSGAIGHFFFAQAFKSGVTGLWSTHPPLDERIRAIDPQFDGKYFEPPTIVDVAHDSFVTAGLVSAAPATPVFDPTAVVGSIGRLSSDDLANAQQLLEQVPAPLHAAAHSSAEAPALLYALLLDDDTAIRSRQRDLIARGDVAALAVVDRLEPALRQTAARHKLPLLQLALPTLKTMPRSDFAAFFGVLDELVHCDDRVSPFEFALQKLVIAALDPEERKAGVVQVYSFQAVADPISVVLSVLARATSGTEARAATAFAAGAAQLKLIADRLTLRAATDSTLPALDAALDRLAGANGPIKQRTLIAAAHVISADRQILVEEGELLRAVAATLQCPMPPIEAVA